MNTSLAGIRNLLFDLGGVIINLDRQRCVDALFGGIRRLRHERLRIYFRPGIYPEMVSCPVRLAGTRFEKIGGTQYRCVGTDRGQLFDIALSGCTHAYRAGHTRRGISDMIQGD